MARILIADDEPGIRTFLGEAIEKIGHEVVTVADGEAALSLLEQGPFELLLTDLRMPRLDGMSLLVRAKKLDPELEVVILTAFGTIDAAVEAIRAGAFDYLQKPVENLRQLRGLVERALAQRAARLPPELGAGAPQLGYGDPSMDEVTRSLQSVAPTDSTVLLLGESGTGKELAARAIHAWSGRAQGPFAAVNCATLSSTLLMSDLFGHERGSFTGATERRLGRLELTAGGTFFLDEVGELELELQAKLLRVLEGRTFERLGGSQTLRADVRWVAATNRDLSKMLSEGRFRADLYHRLGVFPVELPPLRSRRADLVPLADALVRTIARELARPQPQLSGEAVAALLQHDWPGNIRELRNTLERAMILAAGASSIDATHIRIDARARRGGHSLADLEREAVIAALAAEGGHRKRAAERLGMGLRTLYEKIKRYGL